VRVAVQEETACQSAEDLILLFIKKRLQLKKGGRQKKLVETQSIGRSPSEPRELKIAGGAHCGVH